MLGWCYVTLEPMCMQDEAQFHFKEFTNLDNGKNADFLIHSMDVMNSLESIQKIKTKAIASMNLQSGDIILEAGCGHGSDAEKIAGEIGNSGKVLAIDNSQRMINEANRRSTHANVKWSNNSRHKS